MDKISVNYFITRMLKRIIKNFHVFLVSIGINLLKLKNIIYFPGYLYDAFIFFVKNRKFFYLAPVLGDKIAFSGSYDLQYFYQDLIVANYIYKHQPKKHVDIGSRVDGFISNVASFRKIEVFDIRNNSFQHPNIIFKRVDFMNLNNKLLEITDSVSSLHTLEHFGLGRYGDKIDTEGHIKGFKNIIKILKKGGFFYYSTPISDKNRVFFNSERTFNPKEVLNWSNNLILLKFDYIDQKNKVYFNFDINNNKNFKNLNYGCGIYTFKKI